MITVTLEQIESYGPCYDPTPLAGHLTEAPLADVLRRDDVPARDRVWVVCQHLARVDRKLLVRFARHCATYTAAAGAATCTRAAVAVAAAAADVAGAATYTHAAVAAAAHAAVTYTHAGAATYTHAAAAYADAWHVHIEWLLQELDR